jgi:hypothetical protein
MILAGVFSMCGEFEITNGARRDGVTLKQNPSQAALSNVYCTGKMGQGLPLQVGDKWRSWNGRSLRAGGGAYVG